MQPVIKVLYFRLLVCAMAQALRQQPLTSQMPVQSQ